MTLLEIRKMMVNLSGRFDLVGNTTLYPDNGANFFIKAGQRLLDGLLSNPKENQEFTMSLSIGEYSKVMSEVRAIKKVEVYSDDDYNKLDKISLSNLKKFFGSFDQLDTVDRGLPCYYSVGVLRRTEDDPIQNTGTRLFILPPTDKERTFQVTALYMSNQLNDDSDMSWWSINYPDLLIQSALYKAEVFMRNRSGANDWLTDIELAVQLIDNDRVEEAIAGIDQMKDSWHYRYNLPRRSK